VAWKDGASDPIGRGRTLLLPDILLDLPRLGDVLLLPRVQGRGARRLLAEDVAPDEGDDEREVVPGVLAGRDAEDGVELFKGETGDALVCRRVKEETYPFVSGKKSRTRHQPMSCPIVRYARNAVNKGAR
jgi:hypothetical protein